MIHFLVLVEQTIENHAVVKAQIDAGYFLL